MKIWTKCIGSNRPIMSPQSVIINLSSVGSSILPKFLPMLGSLSQLAHLLWCTQRVQKDPVDASEQGISVFSHHALAQEQCEPEEMREVHVCEQGQKVYLHTEPRSKAHSARLQCAAFRPLARWPTTRAPLVYPSFVSFLSTLPGSQPSGCTTLSSAPIKRLSPRFSILPQLLN